MFTSFLAAHYMTREKAEGELEEGNADGGSLVIISSAAGHYASPSVPIYAAAKRELCFCFALLLPLSWTVGHYP